MVKPLDPKELRNAFGSFPTGVTVVTALNESGEPVGFTANSFTSVSLSPPMLLVCPARGLSSFAVFENCQRFVVNVLAEGQESVSNTFASDPGDRFSKISWRADHAGVPLIEHAAARFSCRTHRVVDAGDHLILMGEIDAFDHSHARGLGYVAGNYFSLGLERVAAEAPEAGRATYAGAVVRNGDRVLLCDTGNGFATPRVRVNNRTSPRAAVEEWLSDAGVSTNVGKTYSVFDGEHGEHYIYFLAEATSEDPGDLGTYMPIGDLKDLIFVSSADQSMLMRFALESQTRSFGFYVGDSRSGYVHTVPNTHSSES